MRTIRIVVLLVAVCCIAGCGYHSIARDSESRFADDNTVSIPIFTNKTFKPNIENLLLNNLIDEFSKRRGLRVVEGGQADYTLSGEVRTYNKVAVSYSAFDVIKEYKATMTLMVTFRKNSTQQILWKGELSWSQDFPASSTSDIAFQQNIEDAAIQEICRRLAQQIYLKINEDF